MFPPKLPSSSHFYLFICSSRHCHAFVFAPFAPHFFPLKIFHPPFEVHPATLFFSSPKNHPERENFPFGIYHLKVEHELKTKYAANWVSRQNHPPVSQFSHPPLWHVKRFEVVTWVGGKSRVINDIVLGCVKCSTIYTCRGLAKLLNICSMLLARKLSPGDSKSILSIPKMVIFCEKRGTQFQVTIWAIRWKG